MQRTGFRTTLTALGLAILLATGAQPAAGQADQPHDHSGHIHLTDYAPAPGVAPLLGNLGSHHLPITTSVPLAQRYFDEGLVLTYGFNHAEAIRSFTDAATLDPECAMCQWGIALALGPNINAPMEPAAAPAAWQALQRAQALAPKASVAEQGYIAALARRYGPEPVEDRSALDLAYAGAMRELAAHYPDDPDAATLFAEALMDLTPWQYWTKDGEATAYTAEILATLEGVLARSPEHPGANHFYIHAVEASRQPERAIPSADRLTYVAPGAGHLVHMPAHTYWRVGRYHDAVEANVHAIHADESYIPDRNARGGFYSTVYYPHNIHFLYAAALMEGRSETAIAAAGKLVAGVPEAVYREVPALEDFRPTTLFALVRFGKWAEVLAEPAPAADLRYTTGIWHWARGLAFLQTGDLERAQVEQARLAAIAASPEAAQQGLMSLSTAATLLGIASDVLDAELAGARGQSERQLERLEAAVAIQDGLAYMEPPAWFYPVRQSLGAALLEAGRASEAEAVYREDLRQYPENGWSLFGLARSLEAQGRSAEAAEARQRFELAWRHADIRLTSSGLSPNVADARR
jgi:tetratricopeptide (TPR) repeat protein